VARQPVHEGDPQSFSIVASNESNIKLMTCGPRKRARHPVDSRHDGDFWLFPRKLPTAEIFEVDGLIQLVAQRAGISSAQAALAVSAILGYLTARLPSPVVGRIHEQLGGVQSRPKPDVGDGGVK
jgi:hypothetical protein